MIEKLSPWWIKLWMVSKSLNIFAITNGDAIWIVVSEPSTCLIEWLQLVSVCCRQFCIISVLFFLHILYLCWCTLLASGYCDFSRNILSLFTCFFSWSFIRVRKFLLYLSTRDKDQRRFCFVIPKPNRFFCSTSLKWVSFVIDLSLSHNPTWHSFWFVF